MLYKESIIIPWHRYPDEVPEHGRPVFFKNPAEPTITEINTVGYEHDLSKGSLWVYPDEIRTYTLPADDLLNHFGETESKQGIASLKASCIPDGACCRLCHKIITDDIKCPYGDGYCSMGDCGYYDEIWDEKELKAELEMNED